MAQVEGAELVAIGLANQGESVIAFDRETGAPLSPVVVWSDRRSAAIVAALEGTDAETILADRTGLPLDPYFSAGKIAWLLENVDAVADANRAGRLAVSTLDGFFLHRLSGGARFVTDPSTASRTQLMHLEERRFDGDCAKVFGIALDALPEIGPTVPRDPIPTPLGAPVAATIVDQQAALAALGAVNSGDVKVTYGTGCFIQANAGSTAVRPGGGLLPTLGWELGTGEVAYAIEGGVFTAATAVDWLVGLGLAGSAADVDRLAATAHPGETRFLPAFTGMGAPWWRPGAAGVLAGLRASTTPADIAFAVLEGIAHRVADVLETIEAEQGLPDAIRVDGGLSASETLVQLQADLIGRPVAVSAEREGTAAGAAGLAAIGAGMLDLAGLASRARVAREAGPSISADERATRRAEWRAFVESSAALDPGAAE
jgi:glycerol kinase